MTSKALKGVLRRKNMNPNYHVHCCVIGCRGKISYIMFLHDHLFPCEIPTIRTLALMINWGGLLAW